MTTQPNHHLSTPGAGGVPAVLAQMQGQVRDLGETLWAARNPDELIDTVAEIEALKSTLDGLELAVVRELDATGAVKNLGWASTQDFLTSVAGGHKGAGPAVVRLAKAVDQPVLAVTKGYWEGLPQRVRDHLKCPIVDELQPITQKHDIEGLVMG